MFSFLHKATEYITKQKNYWGTYLLVLGSIYLNFLLFYIKIDHPMHSPLTVIGPTLFTLINSIIFSLPFFFSKKINFYFLIYLYLVDIILIVNTVYFHYYGNVIPFYSYGNVSNLSEFTGSLPDYFGLSDFVFLLSTSAIFLLYLYLKKKSANAISIKIRILGLGGLLFFCSLIIALNYIQDKKNNTTFEQKFYNKDDNQPEFVSYYGILPLWIYQISSHIYSDQKPLNKKEQDEITQFLNKQDKASFGKNILNKNKNVILIIVESLDSWTLNYANGNVTPFLNKLSRDSNAIFIPHILPQVNHGRSADAQLIINTGLLPIFNNTVANLYSKQIYPSLADALKSTHSSLTIMGNKATCWNQQTMNLNYHIDTLISIENLDKKEIIGMGISDKSVFEQTSNILAKNKKPFYCQIITLSSHDGIDFKDYKSNITFPNGLSEDTKGYIKSIQYVDKAIKYFINKLKEKNIYNNSLIIITGDHNGPCREEIAKTSPDVLNSLEVANSITFTPLFIINSELKFSQTPQQVIGEIDIYPTILSIMGINNYFWQGIGNSIFSSQIPTFAISKNFKIIGDTTNCSKNWIQQRKNGWRISDLIIRKKYFNRK